MPRKKKAPSQRTITEHPMAFNPPLLINAMLRDAKEDLGVDLSFLINECLEKSLPGLIKKLIRNRKGEADKLMRKYHRLRNKMPR